MGSVPFRRLARSLRLTGHRLVYGGFAQSPLEARAEGRFNRKEEGRTTYVSLTARTAALEVAKRWGTIAANRAAYVEFAVPVRLRRVMDLTDPDTAAALGVDREMLTGNDLRPCQALATRLRAAGVEGVLTWSAADRQGKNLVIFLDNLDPRSSVGPPTMVKRSEEVGEP